MDSMTLDRVRIEWNEVYANPDSGSNGDGMYVSAADPILVTNVFIARNHGPGIYFNAADSDARIMHATVADNVDYGIYCASGSLNVVNSILWNNGDDLYGASATYSNIDDGDSGTGNISQDPLFVGSGDYHITELSPCIDAAFYLLEPDLVDRDYDDDARPQDIEFDMGADEYAGSPMLNMTLLLDGLYSGGTMTPAQVDIELRYGSTPGTASYVMASYENVTLDENGNTGDIELTGCPAGDLYLFVDHLNHLKIITEERISLDYSDTAIVNLSDTGDPNYMPCLGYEPLGTEVDDALSMRAGDANRDGYVNASGDFVLWLAANGSVPVDPNWDPRTDFNDDDAVNSADHSLWLNQNSRMSFTPGMPSPFKNETGKSNLKCKGLELRFIKAAEHDGKLYAEAELMLHAKTNEVLKAVDAAVKFDPRYLGAPEIVKDYAKNMTDFSLLNEINHVKNAWHYCKAAMPGQTGMPVSEGENVILKLKFPINENMVQAALTGNDDIPAGLMPGLTGAAYESQIRFVKAEKSSMAEQQ